MAAFRAVGADPQLIFIRYLISGKIKITDCDLFCLPGGFSYGDHIDTGIIATVMIQEFIPALMEAKIPGITICNGFQIAVRAGIFGNSIALVQNDSGIFCSRPAKHFVESGDCVWTAGLESQILKFPSWLKDSGKKVIFECFAEIMVKFCNSPILGGNSVISVWFRLRWVIWVCLQKDAGKVRIFLFLAKTN